MSSLPANRITPSVTATAVDTHSHHFIQIPSASSSGHPASRSRSRVLAYPPTPGRVPHPGLPPPPRRPVQQADGAGKDDDEVSERPVFVITGIMAAGKSAVAERLAGRFDRGVHVRGDVYRRMIRSGQVAADPEGGSEAQRQLWLRYRLAARAAEGFHEEDFSVVVQDVILGGFVPRFLALIRVRPLHLVVLAPSPEVVAAREAGRLKNGYGTWTPHTLDLVLRQETPRIGLWLDTSAMTVDETVDAILARGDETSLA